ncbi:MULTISPECIES: ATP-binding cassette domain-containing protein [unclassified Microbulbifer]|uniref:ATP-binding cassette domain-containing protein n=1 Tax=unclassified Microbulbifer TaxID=2619833 RepID=UPI0027E581E9|nr:MULTISPECIES: ATP-binding cassette domain-containing protein [unclassified Microbulbifer]
MTTLLSEVAIKAALAEGTEGLVVEGLCTRVHTAPADLQLPVSGVVGVCGPSGAGKSALLSALAGLMPARGSVCWCGQRWQGRRFSLPLHRRPLSLGFQEARLFANLTVAQNLQLAERYCRRPLREPEREALLDALALKPLLSRPVEQLSGGEAQRVALLRQLLNNAPVQFFDEPLSAVDMPLRIQRIVPALKKFWRDNPALVLWVSHDADELQLLAERFVHVTEGRVTVAEKPPASLHSENPLSAARSHLMLRVREFLPEHQLLVLDLEGQVLYADRAHGRYRAGETVRAMLSAADISLSVGRPSPSSLLNCLPVTLVDSGPLYDGRVRLHLDCGGRKLWAEISKYSYKKLQLKPGQSLFAQFKAGSLQGL